MSVFGIDSSITLPVLEKEVSPNRINQLSLRFNKKNLDGKDFVHRLWK